MCFRMSKSSSLFFVVVNMIEVSISMWMCDYVLPTFTLTFSYAFHVNVVVRKGIVIFSFIKGAWQEEKKKQKRRRMMMMMMTKRRSRLVIFYKKYQQEETTWRCSYVSLCVRKREKQAHTHTRDLLIEFNVDKKKYFFSHTRVRALLQNGTIKDSRLLIYFCVMKRTQYWLQEFPWK